MTIHGTVITNKDSVIGVNEDEKGIITAYLPEMETFAVMFEGVNKWFTFKETEEQFKTRFKKVDKFCTGRII